MQPLVALASAPSCRGVDVARCGVDTVAAVPPSVYVGRKAACAWRESTSLCKLILQRAAWGYEPWRLRFRPRCGVLLIRQPARSWC